MRSWIVMGSLLRLTNWSEWIALKEDNARKRAIRNALAGTGPSLPGSYAACPSTNPRAIKQAAKTGVVGRDSPLKEGESRPDYSFDRWLKKATEFGDDVNKMVGHAQEDEDKIDKDLEDKKQQAKKNSLTKSEPKEKNGEEDDAETATKKEETWKQLRQIHTDRLNQKKSDKEAGPDSAKKLSKP